MDEYFFLKIELEEKRKKNNDMELLLKLPLSTKHI